MISAVGVRTARRPHLGGEILIDAEQQRPESVVEQGRMHVSGLQSTFFPAAASPDIGLPMVVPMGEVEVAKVGGETQAA